MGIKQGLERICGVVLGLGVCTGINFYKHHNVSYEIVQEGKKVFQKADGIFTYTELEINKDGSVNINRYPFGDIRFYTDKDGDGNVDSIFQGSNLFVRGSHSRSFERDKHLKQYPAVFQDADRDFRQQMQRFKPYINR